MIQTALGAEEKILENDPYLLAASVLDTFYPDRLQPVYLKNIPQRSDAINNLVAHALIAKTDGNRYEWRLPDEIRRKMLGVLCKNGLLEHALELNENNSEPGNPYQRMFSLYARRRNPPLESQSLDELQGTLQAARLLQGLVSQLPDIHQVTTLVNREVFLQQFRTLASERFFGRTAEFKKLAKFVDALPTSALGSVRRGALELAGHFFESLLHEPPFLVIGPGGIGKSAFLARFFLDHVEGTTKRPLLFAYLDFDRTTLWPDEPMTILAELVQQIGNQVRSGADAFMQLHRELTRALMTRSGYSADYDSLESMNNSNLSSRQLKRGLDHFRQLLLSEFNNVRDISLLLVFDTFEEVTQRATPHLTSFWEFIRELQKIAPKVRIVLSGRTELPKGLTHEKLILPPLKKPEAEEFLHFHCIDDQANIERIYERVGGHPLSLRLTIQLLQTIASRVAESMDMATKSLLFDGKWEAHLAEGILYRRIISHIDDPKVRKLADPGFVLREVTPDILFKVLNEPCDLGLNNIGQAQELFKALSIYSSLVSPRSSWTLKHRPEVRKMILDSLQISSLSLCRDIWQRAAAFYAGAGTLRNAAEGIYCRLMLDEPADDIMALWRPGMERFLASARDELPAYAKEVLDFAILVSESGKTSPIPTGSDIETLRLAEQMKLLLQRGRPEQALQLHGRTAKERHPSPDSPLFTLITRALAQSGKFAEAMKMAEEGLVFYGTRKSYPADRYLDLLLLLCQTSIFASYHDPKQIDKSISAEFLLDRLSRVEQTPDTDYEIFRIHIHILTLHEIELGAAHEKVALNAETIQLSMRPNLSIPDDAIYRRCAPPILDALEIFNDEQRGSEGLLHLRAFGLLGRYVPRHPGLRRIITAPVIRQLLRSEFSTIFVQLDQNIRGLDKEAAAAVKQVAHFMRQLPEATPFLDQSLPDSACRLLAYLVLHEIRVRDIGNPAINA